MSTSSQRKNKQGSGNTPIIGLHWQNLDAPINARKVSNYVGKSYEMSYSFLTDTSGEGVHLSGLDWHLHFSKVIF
jgi:hypothetical protein